MSLVKFGVLQAYINSYSTVEAELSDASRNKLYDLHYLLEHAFNNAATWYNVLEAGKRRILPQNQVLIVKTYKLLEAALNSVLSAIVLAEITEVEEQWGGMLDPAQAQNNADYDYGLLSSYSGDEFSAEMDETWYPAPAGGSM